MKVNEPPPVQPKRIVGRRRSVPPAGGAGGSRSEDSPDGHEDQAPEHDTTAVQGVAADGIAPSVREAMANLIGEVAELREALDQSNKRLDYLTTLADQDSLSTLLNRRAFVRELSRALVLARQGQVGSTLIVLEIENLKEINVRLGMAAGDAAIEHAAGIVRDQFAEGTVAGRLGGAEFGLVLVGEPVDPARAQAQNLALALAARPLIWEGKEISLALQWGLHSLRSGEDANAAMNAADRAMRWPDI
jgi:diguanylate cyclase (GGDEF)-like protein